MHNTTTNPWTLTRHSWNRQRHAPATRRYLRTLRHHDPAAAPYRNADALVDVAARYDDTGTHLADLLLQHASDPVASVLLFEAARPRLAHLARQARGYAHQTRCPELIDPDRTAPWEQPDVIDADVVSWAYEWIARHAGQSHPHPIRAMRDWIRDQLRAAATRAIRIEHATRQLTTDAETAVDDNDDPDAVPPASRLYTVLAAARDASLITPADAALIFTTRAGDTTLDQAAARDGIAYDTARRRRRRAEATLEHAGHDLTLVDA